MRRDVHALYLACRDPRIPWYAKALAIVVACYAVSPIDLIPDFIPVIGLLDDLILVPAGIWLAVQLIPADVMAEYRALAIATQDRPVNRTAAVVVVAVWIVATAFFCWRLFEWIKGRV